MKRLIDRLCAMLPTVAAGASVTAAMLLTAVAPCGLTACAGSEETAEEPAPAVKPTDNEWERTYSVSIAATMGGEETRAVAIDQNAQGKDYLVSTFRTTDNIAVYNKTKGYMAMKQGGDIMYLHADADAKEANLTGGLAFYDGDTYHAVETDDVLLLMYNGEGGSFDYQNRDNGDGTSGQKGTLASLSDYDFATAEVTVTGVSGAGTTDEPYTLTTSEAAFTNQQSMFKLTFTGLPEEFSTNPSGAGINKITIHSEKNKLIHYYNPATGNELVEDIVITLGGSSNAAGNARLANGAGNVVYAALRFMPLSSGETDEITFTIECTDGKTYYATKTSPAGGFQNGKYYTATIAAYDLSGGRLWAGGPYWAACNVGAEEPWEFGYYFWWGDLVGYTRSGGTWDERNRRFYDVKWVSSAGDEMDKDDSPFSESSCPTFDKDNTTLLSEGWIYEVDPPIVTNTTNTVTGNLAPEHDAATKNVGTLSLWRMPTYKEIQALIDNCTTKWTTINGFKGRLVTGKDAYANRSIFLPAAGYGAPGEKKNDTNETITTKDLIGPGSEGYYWASTPVTGRETQAWSLYFNSNSRNFSLKSNAFRYYGLSIRPVRVSTKSNMNVVYENEDI